MAFPYDATGINSTGGLLPDDKYALRIITAKEGVTKNGDLKVTVNYEVAKGDYAGKEVGNHTITFFKDKTIKGANMAIHFLKCIEQPWEGSFIVNPSAWIGCYITGKTVQETYQDKTYPKIKFVDKYVSGPIDYTTRLPALEKDEEIPF